MVFKLIKFTDDGNLFMPKTSFSFRPLLKECIVKYESHMLVLFVFSLFF